METNNKCKDQLHTENYSLYNSDVMEILPTLENESIDLSIYSPPFADLYVYSSDERDFSNNSSLEEAMKQYEFLVKEMSRVTKAGRINAVHCIDYLKNVTTNVLWDYPGEIIRIHERNGFDYVNRITIWKEPLKVRIRTMVQSLMHKWIVEDSTRCFTAQPDYILVFKKRGKNKVPVTHEFGLTHYAGDKPILEGINDNFGTFEQLQKKYKDWKDPKTNKLSHIIWQRYASSIWDDIRNEHFLSYKDSKEDDDEKHVHPLQLDVIDRLVELYSNPNEVILTPFMGVGSEVYSPVSLGRKAIGIELKDSYYKQAILNLKEAENRFFEDIRQQSLF